MGNPKESAGKQKVKIIFYVNPDQSEGAKHTSGGDETPPIPEEELEQQKIEHERQLQKEKECQAREAEEVRQLDIKLLHQRAIEAEEEHKREIAEAVEELRGLNTSWSHHRLCDLQRQAARWRHSRPSIPDTKHYRNVLKKACSAQLTKPQSSQSISDTEGIFINLSRLDSCRDESIDSDGCCETPCCVGVEEGRDWRASANDVSPTVKRDLVKTPSCPGANTSGAMGESLEIITLSICSRFALDLIRSLVGTILRLHLRNVNLRTDAMGNI